jgi:hypothetical protein
MSDTSLRIGLLGYNTITIGVWVRGMGKGYGLGVWVRVWIKGKDWGMRIRGEYLGDKGQGLLSYDTNTLMMIFT